MGQKFQYDESGGTFFYFVLSFLALVLIPATFYYWPRKKKIDPEEENKKCHCPPCIEKRLHLKKAEPWRGLRDFLIKLLIVVGWALLLFLAYKVSQFDYEMANFDPYEIIGIPVGASQNEIKKAYRRLSLILHPDKDTGDEKAFMKLTKAYQALTDDEARKNWEKYGNPDGPGAMSFGIALPSWIVEKENSVWVLGLYALVFMFALPIVVGTWWYRSIKFTGDQVLLDTINMYYFFFHKTPHMILKRIIMVLAASFEFDRNHNSEIIDRETDNKEIPQLFKQLPYVQEKNKEPFLSQNYSIKTRTIIHAHLMRVPLNPLTLEQDRRYIIRKCPYLIHEQVNCINQLVMLGYAGRVQNIPFIESIENCMKLCPMIIQALWEHKSPLLQLPYITEDNLKYFIAKKRNIKSIQQFAQLKSEERRNILRSFTDEQFDDVMKVLGNMPYVDFHVECEVVDDENPTEVTAGAIVTVTVTLKRKNMSSLFGDETVKDNTLSNSETAEIEMKENHNGEGDTEANAQPQVKRPAWMKQQKRGGGKKTKKPPKQHKPTVKTQNKVEESPNPTENKKKNKEEKDKQKNKEEKDTQSEDSDVSDIEEIGDNNGDNEDRSSDDENGKEPSEDDDEEWEKFKTIRDRERLLEGKSKTSCPVHCPHFPGEKQEYWWTYICDRKSRTLLTAPYHVTSLVNEETIHLRFTAPNWPGLYTFTVCLRSDSYIGFDQQKDIKLDVKQRHKEIVNHPQWEFGDSDEEKVAENDAQESDFTTDDDIPDDED